MPPRQDVEENVYERLYGPRGATGEEGTRILGGDDPAVFGAGPAAPDRAAGRTLGALAGALRGRVRTWLATGSVSEDAARRRASVVAPAPSLVRTLAVAAVAAALVGIAALGALVPDRATEEPSASTSSAGRDTAASAAPAQRERPGARAQARHRMHRRARHRARTAHAGASRSQAPRVVATSGRDAPAASVPAQASSSDGTGCSDRGGCVITGGPAEGDVGTTQVVPTGPPDGVVTGSTPGAGVGSESLGGGGASDGGVVVVEPAP